MIFSCDEVLNNVKFFKHSLNCTYYNSFTYVNIKSKTIYWNTMKWNKWVNFNENYMLITTILLCVLVDLV